MDCWVLLCNGHHIRPSHTDGSVSLMFNQKNAMKNTCINILLAACFLPLRLVTDCPPIVLAGKLLIQKNSGCILYTEAL